MSVSRSVYCAIEKFLWQTHQIAIGEQIAFDSFLDIYLCNYRLRFHQSSVTFHHILL